MGEDHQCASKDAENSSTRTHRTLGQLIGRNFIVRQQRANGACTNAAAAVARERCDLSFPSCSASDEKHGSRENDQ
jgi:hypothetical protein